jgi:hypothetical protein
MALAQLGLCLFSPTACNLLRPGESYAGIIDLPMKPFYQFAAAVMLLLFFGVTGADCLVPNAQMSAAEKACCRQMAGQCDMDMAAKHPCCQKLVQRHDDADVNDLSHSAPQTLPVQVATLASDFSLRVSMRSFVLPERLEHPPHDPPIPSVEILRV